MTALPSSFIVCGHIWHRALPCQPRNDLAAPFAGRTWNQQGTLAFNFAILPVFIADHDCVRFGVSKLYPSPQVLVGESGRSTLQTGVGRLRGWLEGDVGRIIPEHELFCWLVPSVWTRGDQTGERLSDRIRLILKCGGRRFFLFTCKLQLRSRAHRTEGLWCLPGMTTCIINS